MRRLPRWRDGKGERRLCRWTGGTRRELPDEGWRGWLRRKAGDELFDLAFRPSGRQGQHVAMVLVGEVWCEQTQSGQVHLTRAISSDNSRPAPSGPGHGDPVVGGVLGETELTDTEGEHRREGEVEIELPRVDLTQMDQEIRLDSASRPDELARGGEEVIAAH